MPLKKANTPTIKQAVAIALKAARESGKRSRNGVT
jgi:hypothetical protein